ncbi:MAG: hypothetical protein COU81_03770 [Candidatus Portnoybacteria bacterium CG10_big_fil_rev_8_21_14_0_10_36_7]|uniref:Uncharacterized protein n=1 Tax=Candidatus Portnoybacteria bacterium CG10_big_fil_rev_8_21_14_0_10_36_7 TaxID=1974812 RepID=A0A2M8KDA2_9BACT|nr:MAG: hypothetical protein COU81_03770 [Candidatus Portnoybacteria bacterium CG10_big_fil_rev_8_21_14_0_10_36_7]
MLLIPGDIPLKELKDKMTMEYGYWKGSGFKKGGSFAKAKSKNVDKHPRIILINKTQNLKDCPELEQTFSIKGKDVNLD